MGLGEWWLITKEGAAIPEYSYYAELDMKRTVRQEFNINISIKPKDY